MFKHGTKFKQGTMFKHRHPGLNRGAVTSFIKPSGTFEPNVVAIFMVNS